MQAQEKKRFSTQASGLDEVHLKKKKKQHLLSPECCFVSFHPSLMKQLYCFFLKTEKAPLLSKKVVGVGVL